MAERQNAILFIPKYLAKGFDFIAFMTVIKTASYTEFNYFNLEEVKRRFAGMTDECYRYLVRISNPGIFNFTETKAREYRKLQSGKDIERLVLKSRNRYLNEAFLHGLPHWQNLLWFHLIQDPVTRKPVKTPCQFLNEPTSLKFFVEHTAERGLTLLKYLEVKKELYLVDDFRRTLFLLEYNNQYVVLSPGDYQALEWLEEINLAILAFQPREFLTQVVLKLESSGLNVDRNHCFPIQEIHSAPESMVWVHEISDTFLEFIPCWSYEGIKVEGRYTPTLDVQRQEEMYRIFRHKEKEAELINNIREKHPSFKQQFNGKFFIHFDEARKNNWFFAIYQAWLDSGIQMLGLDQLQHFKYSSHKISTNLVRIGSENGQTFLQMEVRFGAEIISNRELRKVILAGQKSIVLQDNTIGILPEEWRAQHALLIKHAHIDGSQLTVSDWLLHQEPGILTGEDLQKSNTEEVRVKWRQWQEGHTEIFTLPKEIQAVLRPYQRKGFEWMALLSEMSSGACLADDMGLGKTIQTICFLSWLNKAHPQYRFLIVCPASLLYNWRAEFEKFAPHLESRIFKGGLTELASFFSSTDSILIAGYGLVRSQVDLLESYTWGGVVIDESHNIKNPSAQITRAIHRLKGRHRVALSGTPVMNNTFDLYAQVEFIVPGLLGSPEFFAREYAIPIDKDGDREKMAILSRLTAPFILRRTKKQVAPDLPEKTESILWCEMEDRQRAVYEETKKSIRDNIFLHIKNDGLAKSKIGILAGIIRLRQICCAPSLLKEFEGSPPDDSIKLGVLLDELNNLQASSKALVFSQFKDMLHLIASRLNQCGIPHYHFDGDTAVEERQIKVKAFQEENDPAKVFLISLKAGNTGLNLTAADYVFLVDPWWNTAVQQQAIDRTHRIGQNNHVFAYKMICKNTIEERIIQLQQKKQWISDELIRAEEGFVKNLSEEDVSFLFS